MKQNISKFRQRMVDRRQRSFTANRQKLPFKDSVALETLYYIILLILHVAAAAWVHKWRPDASELLVRSIGIALLSALSILSMRLLLVLLAPEQTGRNSRKCLGLLICFMSLATTTAILVFRDMGIFTSYLAAHKIFVYPYVLAPALGALLLGTGTGLALGIGTSMLMAMLAPYDDALAVLSLGIFAAIIVSQLVTAEVKRRLKLIKVLFICSLILAVGPLLQAAFNFGGAQDTGTIQEHLQRVAMQAGTCTLAGVAYGFFIICILPLLEHVFALASNIKLNNYADLDHPLLYRLANEAPGTSNHSITMATISAAAAERIGANPLLARVGAYYHDIGKLSSPELFIENTTPERNPHRTLKPSTSAQWVKSHVKDGIVLANKHRLPPPIKAFIWEHHGTTAMAVFLHKAREASRAENEKLADKSQRSIVEESQFRYPGPRPRSRESGIIMLADSVEAAARAMDKPTPSALFSLVNDIVEAKLKDGQLDECPLTIKDLATVKQSFVSSLTTILHARIAYPTANDKDNSQNRESPDAAQGRP